MSNKLIDMEEPKRKVFGYLEKKHPVLLHGPAGIGKTGLALEIGKEKKWKIIRINASEARTKKRLEWVYRLARTKPTKVILFLIDEIDGFHDWGYLQKILLNCKHPIIMTANEYSDKGWGIPTWVFKNPKTKRKFVRTLKIWPPRHDQLVRILKQKGMKGDFSKVTTRDVRSSMLAMSNDAESYVDYSPFELIKIMINNPKVIVKEVEKIGNWRFWRDWRYWFTHNLPIFHRGIDLFMSMEILSEVDLYNNPLLLQYLPKPILGGRGKKPEYPEYLKTLKKYKNKNRKKERKN